LQLNIFPLLYY